MIYFSPIGGSNNGEIFPKSAIELKGLVKSASKIVRAGEGFLYDTL